jgi:probable DNA metabolism protein
MKIVRIEPDFDLWRDAARKALLEGYRPQEIDFQDATAVHESSLFVEPEGRVTGVTIPQVRATQEFLRDASEVASHRDPTRWNLLYRVLYRLQSERHLLKIETDVDVSAMLKLRSQVRRDLHKMHAFVRFRKVLEPAHALPIFDSQDESLVTLKETAELNDGLVEHYIAWYQPDHRILAMAAPFFLERFAVMRWTILTPDGSVSWDPARRELLHGPGVPLSSAPSSDDVEVLWRSYYKSIYNPARLNTSAMRSEMPVRYWKNLPELDTLPALISESSGRVGTMLSVQQGKKSAASFVPSMHTLEAIADALPACQGCELYCHATQVVGGQGNRDARVLLVGEQPGDQEDRQGLPFVGPAGVLLDQILEELGMDRSKMYVTNAVKHFKYVQRGKLRLHANPRMPEITACKPWLLAELDAVQPRVVVCLGASAAKSLFGGTFELMKSRGQILSTPYAERVIATLHPSAILRAPDEARRAEMKGLLMDDLMLAYQLERSL